MCRAENVSLKTIIQKWTKFYYSRMKIKNFIRCLIIRGKLENKYILLVSSLYKMQTHYLVYARSINKVCLLKLFTVLFVS